MGRDGLSLKRRLDCFALGHLAAQCCSADAAKKANFADLMRAKRPRCLLSMRGGVTDLVSYNGRARKGQGDSIRAFSEDQNGLRLNVVCC